MRAVSAVYAAGLIAMIAISASSFILASMHSGSEVQRFREKSIKLEADRAMERLKALYTRAGLEVRNEGGVEAGLLYAIYPNGTAVRLDREIAPGESISLQLNGVTALVTERGNLIEPSYEDGQLDEWDDVRFLASKDQLLYDSGFIYVGGEFSPFSLPQADGQEYERPIMVSGERIYTLNFDDGELFLKAYSPLPLAGKDVVGELETGEAGYVFEFEWGYVIATVKPYTYSSGFDYKILKWNDGELKFVKDFPLSPLSQGTYPIAASNGTHIIELKIGQGTSSYRIIEPHSSGLSIVDEGTFYIPKAGFPSSPYFEESKQTATIAALAKGDRLVVASMNEAFSLYITSIHMPEWTAIGEKTDIYGYRALPGLMLISDDELIVFERLERVLAFNLSDLSEISEMRWPITKYEPVAGHWFGLSGSDVWYFGPPCTAVFYQDIYPKYFGLYLLNDTNFAITTAAGAEIFDPFLREVGIVQAGGPVKQAHLCQDGWKFIVWTHERKLKVVG